MNLSFWDKNKKQAPLKVNHLEANAAHSLSEQLFSYLHHLHPRRECIVVCIGTDRSTGDALGPLVGTSLVQKSAGFHVYGTLNEPVHAMNLQETLQKVNERHYRPFIIAVDACLGQLSSVGTIQLAHGPVKPGAGVNKELPPVGDVHLTGIVNVGGFMEYFVLQNTRLSLVFQMAEVIAATIYRAVTAYSPESDTAISAAQPD